MFKVGQLIICKKEKDRYTCTNAGVVCEVVEVSRNGDARLKVSEIVDKNYYEQKSKGNKAPKNVFWIPAEYLNDFKLYDSDWD